MGTERVHGDQRRRSGRRRHHRRSAEREGDAPAWGSYITVDDVDAVVARVAGLGGRVLLAPTDIPTVGRFATIVDPQGATISLITYAMKN